MRPQVNPNPQESGEQKKSVFDRLGRQLDTNRPLNRRSPVHYGEHPMHPMMHEAEFSARYGRGDPSMVDMNAWRYQNDRRHLLYGRERHPPPMGPMPPMHFDVDMQSERQQPLYYMHPHQPIYHSTPTMQPGPPPPQIMGLEAIGMGIPQRRPSPKYDRHGNPIRGSMRLDPLGGMSQPGNSMGPPPGPMMHPAAYDMSPLRPGMYPLNRWHENLEMGPPIVGRLLPDERFLEQQRMQQLQQQQHQQQKNQMINIELGSGAVTNSEAPRYSKWRERRDVITNLDRQTAQSSSKTDSLKSSLQQTETRNQGRKNNKDFKQSHRDVTTANKQSIVKKDSTLGQGKSETASKSEIKPSTKTDLSEISDGEIVDDEDSSDESEAPKLHDSRGLTDIAQEEVVRNRMRGHYGRMASQNLHYYDSKKRRRMHERDDYPMDYETISDEELDDFMSDKKLGGSDKIDGRSSSDLKDSSEMELLNALGLDWANLVEMSRQSRKEAPMGGSALRRFSALNYLPSLGITKELAGQPIYDLIQKVCH